MHNQPLGRRVFMVEKKSQEKHYTESEMQWAKLHAFVSGFLAACVAVAGIVTLIAQIQGMLK